MVVNQNSYVIRRVNFGWISESFQIFSRDGWSWSLALLILFVVSVGFFGMLFLLQMLLIGGFSSLSSGTAASSGLTSVYWFRELVADIFVIPFNAFLLGGLFKMSNKSVRGQFISAGDLFSGWSTMTAFLILSSLYELCDFGSTMLGMYLYSLCTSGRYAIAISLFVVWAIVASSLLALFIPVYSIAADGESAVSAIKKSVSGMKADVWIGIPLVLVFGLLYCVSLLPCLLGAFFTIPMALIIGSLAYRDMVGMPGVQTGHGRSDHCSNRILAATAVRPGGSSL